MQFLIDFLPKQTTYITASTGMAAINIGGKTSLLFFFFSFCYFWFLFVIFLFYFSASKEKEKETET